MRRVEPSYDLQPRNGATLKEAGQYIRSLSRIEEQELELALDTVTAG
jgi:hypothetical protein